MEISCTGSFNIGAHVLITSLNMLRKSDKMLGKPPIVSLILNTPNEVISAEPFMIDHLLLEALNTFITLMFIWHISNRWQSKTLYTIDERRSKE